MLVDFTNQEWSKKDSAWAVFDGDEHMEQSYANWKSAIDRANSQDIQLAITNPCFEGSSVFSVLNL